MSTKKDYPLIIRLTFSLLFVILVLYALVVARNFLYPFVLAILFAYLLYPFVQFLENIRLPRIPAVLVSILLGIFMVGVLMFVMYRQLTGFAGDLPELRDQAIVNVNALEGFINRKLDFLGEQREEGWLQRNALSLFDVSGEFVKNAFSATTGTITKIGLIPVYIFFLLYYRDKFKFFFYSLIPGEQHLTAGSIMNDISFVTKKYMVGVVIVILILCVLNSIGLIIVGLQYPILLGIISALFNFIPYFGTLIGGLIPLIMALLTGSPSKALGVVVLFMIIQFTENNILTPNITGGQVRINPFFTILSIIIAGIIWGIPGMFISVPLLGMFKIICDHSKELAPYSFLLGTQGTEKHALTWEKIKGFFKSKKEEK